MLNRVLDGTIKNGRIAHAYLFAEGDAEDKLAQALSFARSLNCKELGCGKCLSCDKANRGIHPDIIVIGPEEDAATIKIDQIRQLKDLTRYGPSEGQYQVIIIKDADILTPEAANSFLKLLEEPPPQVTFILISNREESLPKTILSRCQRIIFPEGKISVNEDSKTLFDALNKKPFDYILNTQRLLEFPASGTAEELFSDLFILYAQAQAVKKARSVFEALKGVKKRGNQKLICDYLGYKLWKEN